MRSKQQRNMWVFGYGSLIWKADFPYEEKIIGHIKGYVRRFYQKSTDHRGVPGRPGRVVTLLASKSLEDEVWGCAYKIASENIESVTQHLDFRETNYDKKDVLFYPSHSQVQQRPFHLFIYIGHEDNPSFAGYEDINTIANHIAECAGVSGRNTEYLYNLATAMRTIAPKVYDEHLYKLEDAVKRIELLKKDKTLEFDQRNRNNHNISIKFICICCEKQFQNRFGLKEHMRRKDNGKKLHKQVNPNNKSYDNSMQQTIHLKNLAIMKKEIA